MLQNSDLNRSIDGWLDDLSEKQREVLARRFGLRGHDVCTLEQVGREIGLTRERVRQIQGEALKRLREIMEKDRKSTRLNSSHVAITYAVICMKKKKK